MENLLKKIKLFQTKKVFRNETTKYALSLYNKVNEINVTET